MSVLSSIAAHAVADHEIVIYYDVDGIHPTKGPGIQFSKLANSSSFPSDQSPALAGRYGRKAVWRMEESRVAGGDFHDHIGNILSGKRPDHVTFWEMTPEAARLLKTADLYAEDTAREARVAKSLTLAFSKAAQRRLLEHGIASDRLAVVVEGLELALFMTGHGFCMARIAVARPDGTAPSALEVLEVT